MNYGAEPADQVENKTYQNVKGTAPDEIFYCSG